ncbi:MAG: hypothetical protein WDW36_007106 [Sanguina aurantia]
MGAAGRQIHHGAACCSLQSHDVWEAASWVYNTMTGVCMHTLTGHEGEISKVAFNPQGTRLLTASSDKTCKLWDTETAACLQTLEGHTDEIFSCAFNYEGDSMITGSKDNTCRIWKAGDLYGTGGGAGAAGAFGTRRSGSGAGYGEDQ